MSIHRASWTAPLALLFLLLASRHGLGAGAPVVAELRAGAARVDVSPRELPVIVSGGFTERTSDATHDPLHARSLVLSRGDETVAIVVVDSCMIPRDLCDRAKVAAHERTGIPTERMLIAATHTHSAPSAMDFCLGTRRDETYARQLVPQIAECIAQAHARREPARVGWAVVDAPEHTHCRRWIRQPNKADLDPFGDRTVLAMMHPGYQNPDYLGPAGPADTGLSVLSVQSLSGRPLCVLANYSMHYFGWSQGLSADYYGIFARLLEERIAKTGDESKPFVAVLSQGTSGDLHWMDYSRPQRSISIEQYSSELAELAFGAYSKIEYRDDVELAMAQTELSLRRRVPEEARLEWARKLNAERGDRRPQSRPEVYAEQAVWIDEHPSETVLLQAVRIGDLGITALPCEVYGVTGLKLKARSPLRPTFNLELANGAAGYIPPPEQHRLGGYTTWPARTAGLEIDAEPKIVDALLGLLEEVSGKPRRPPMVDPYPPEIRANMRRALLSSAGPPSPSRAQPPNVLIVMADDCTYRDLPIYGGRNARTPRIDRLASEGLVFNRAYLSEAMCQPCRAELYTGQYPLRNGCAWNHSASRPSTRSTPHRLRPLGYRVGLAGKVHVLPDDSFPFEKVGGFEPNCVRNPTRPHDVGPMRRFLSRDAEQPFFLVVALVEPHVPWVMGDPSRYPPEKIELPANIADTQRTREDFSRYVAEITYMDGQVGDILDVLEETGHARDTLVLFTSEQGAQFPGCKWTNWDTGLHTALVVRWPGRVEAGRRTDALVQYADVLPTLVDVAGGDPSEGEYDGTSFLSVLLGTTDTHRELVYGVHNNIPEGPAYPIRTVFDGTYRYIRNLTPDEIYIEKHVMGSTGDGSLNNPYWATWLWDASDDPHTYALVKRYTHRPAEELYNTAEDPYELNNIVGDASRAAIQERLRGALERWMASQGDPGAPEDTQEAIQAARRGEHLYGPPRSPIR